MTKRDGELIANAINMALVKNKDIEPIKSVIRELIINFQAEDSDFDAAKFLRMTNVLKISKIEEYM